MFEVNFKFNIPALRGDRRKNKESGMKMHKGGLNHIIEYIIFATVLKCSAPKWILSTCKLPRFPQKWRSISGSGYNQRGLGTFFWRQYEWRAWRVRKSIFRMEPGLMSAFRNRMRTSVSLKRRQRYFSVLDKKGSCSKVKGTPLCITRRQPLVSRNFFAHLA